MMKLCECEGKNARIKLMNGHIYAGVLYQYTSALDNEPDGACIYIGYTEILETEIESIESMEIID